MFNNDIKLTNEVALKSVNGTPTLSLYWLTKTAPEIDFLFK